MAVEVVKLKPVGTLCDECKTASDAKYTCKIPLSIVGGPSCCKTGEAKVADDAMSDACEGEIAVSAGELGLGKLIMSTETTEPK